MEKDNNEKNKKINKTKSVLMILLAAIVAIGLLAYALTSPNSNYSVALIIIAAILLILFGIFGFRRYRDAEKGMPFEDERSRKVIEKAAAKSFYVTLYLLLIIGWLSEKTISFRDVSQACSAAIGITALAFFAFWLYYNKKEI